MLPAGLQGPVLLEDQVQQQPRNDKSIHHRARHAHAVRLSQTTNCEHKQHPWKNPTQNVANHPEPQCSPLSHRVNFGFLASPLAAVAVVVVVVAAAAVVAVAAAAVVAAAAAAVVVAAAAAVVAAAAAVAAVVVVVVITVFSSLRLFSLSSSSF